LENPNLSGPFIAGSLRLENSKGLTLEDFLTILGIFLGLNYFKSNYTKDLRTGQYLFLRQVDSMNLPSPYHNTDLSLYFEGMSLNC